MLVSNQEKSIILMCISMRFSLMLITLLTKCLGSESAVWQKNVLGNEGSMTLMSFQAPLGVDASIINCNWLHNGNTISIDGKKYVQPGPRSLQINSIVGEDEGVYTCNYTYNHQQFSESVAYINVIGVASFAIEQQQNITTNVGGTAQFDTSVIFTGAGLQQRKQRVNLFQLYKDNKQLYLCRNWSPFVGLPCSSAGRFTVAMQGSEKFNLFLELSNVSLNDSGSYEARLEVIHPETGSYSVLQKEITLNVTGQAKPIEVKEGNKNASTHVQIADGLFQLCIGPFFLSDCSALAVDSAKGVQLESQIRAEVTQYVIKHCPQCFNESLEYFIQPGTLKCSKTAARLIYRSTIETNNSSHNASEIVQIIEGWVTSTDPGQATLNLWPFVMDLDSRCAVSITSLNSPYPILGAPGSQAQFSRIKDHIESCLSDISQP